MAETDSQATKHTAAGSAQVFSTHVPGTNMAHALHHLDVTLCSFYACICVVPAASNEVNPCVPIEAMGITSGLSAGPKRSKEHITTQATHGTGNMALATPSTYCDSHLAKKPVGTSLTPTLAPAIAIARWGVTQRVSTSTLVLSRTVGCFLRTHSRASRSSQGVYSLQILENVGHFQFAAVAFPVRSCGVPCSQLWCSLFAAAEFPDRNQPISPHRSSSLPLSLPQTLGAASRKSPQLQSGASIRSPFWTSEGWGWLGEDAGGTVSKGHE